MIDVKQVQWRIHVGHSRSTGGVYRSTSSYSNRSVVRNSQDHHTATYRWFADVTAAKCELRSKGQIQKSKGKSSMRLGPCFAGCDDAHCHDGRAREPVVRCRSASSRAECGAVHSMAGGMSPSKTSRRRWSRRARRVLREEDPLLIARASSARGGGGRRFGGGEERKEGTMSS